MMNDEAVKIAKEIKAKVDMLVDDYGVDAIESLEDVRDMNRWTVLKGEQSSTILLAMRMYIFGIVRTLYREKNKK